MSDDEPEEPVEDPDPDLEDTMRLGLQEIANEAPRGKNVWDTTASMIAIHVEQVAKDDPTISLPPVPPRTSEIGATSPTPSDDPGSSARPASRRLVIAALIGLLLVAIALTILLATR